MCMTHGAWGSGGQPWECKRDTRAGLTALLGRCGTPNLTGLCIHGHNDNPRPLHVSMLTLWPMRSLLL